MCRIKLSSLTCPALPYFSTLSPKRHDFRKNVPEQFSVRSQNIVCSLVAHIFMKHDGGKLKFLVKFLLDTTAA
jgi:hypothetical protein